MEPLHTTPSPRFPGAKRPFCRATAHPRPPSRRATCPLLSGRPLLPPREDIGTTPECRRREGPRSMRSQRVEVYANEFDCWRGCERLFAALLRVRGPCVCVDLDRQLLPWAKIHRRCRQACIASDLEVSAAASRAGHPGRWPDGCPSVRRPRGRGRPRCRVGLSTLIAWCSPHPLGDGDQVFVCLLR